MKKYVFLLLKFAIPLAIIIWLLANIEEQQLNQLRDRPKNWPLLGVAFAISMAAVCLTFARWYLLVRALKLRFRLRDSFRLGFLGYLLNFVSVGAVGGDLFKAFFIAHEQPGRRTEAVATVVVDRMIGLYALLVVTSIAILLGNITDPTPEVKAICNLTFLCTGIGGVGVLMVMIPGFTSGSASEMLGNLPKIGPPLERLILAVRMYRNQPATLLLIAAMSLCSHSMFAVSVFLIAVSLFEQVPTLAEHFIVVPLSMVAGALPFTPGGLGAFELAMDKLYLLLPAQAGDVSGVTVALAYRVITIAIAAVGVVYYWTSRQEVREILHEAELDQQHQAEQHEPAPSPAEADRETRETGRQGATR